MTFNHRSKAPPVLEQNHLLPVLQRLTYLTQQDRRKLSRHPFLACQFLCVHQFDVRQLQIPVPLFQLHPGILAVQRLIIRLYAGSSRTQQRLRPIHGSQDDGRIPRMIPGSRILLLVRSLVLLVHNHQSQSPERQEDRRPYSQNHVIIVLRELLLPDLHPFRIRELGMIYPQTVAEHPPQTFRNLSGKGNFRQQIQHLFTCLYGLKDKMYIDFSLAAGCHPMKQTHILLMKRIHDLLKSRLLSLTQRIRRTGLHTTFLQAAHLLPVEFEHPFSDQLLHNGRRSP